MKPARSAFITLAVSALAGIAAGCGGQHAPHTPHSEKAVMCDKCQTTWVNVSTTTGKMHSYHREKVMVCPDCTSAAENFFKTGKFEHTCSHCQGSMTCVDPDPQ